MAQAEMGTEELPHRLAEETSPDASGRPASIDEIVALLADERVDQLIEVSVSPRDFDRVLAVAFRRVGAERQTWFATALAEALERRGDREMLVKAAVLLMQRRLPRQCLSCLDALQRLGHRNHNLNVLRISAARAAGDEPVILEALRWHLAEPAARLKPAELREVVTAFDTARAEDKAMLRDDLMARIAEQDYASHELFFGLFVPLRGSEQALRAFEPVLAGRDDARDLRDAAAGVGKARLDALEKVAESCERGNGGDWRSYFRMLDAAQDREGVCAAFERLARGGVDLLDCAGAYLDAARALDRFGAAVSFVHSVIPKDAPAAVRALTLSARGG